MALKTSSYIVFYNSKSHQLTRYFVGLTNVVCSGCGKAHLIKPTWTPDREAASIFTAHEAMTAKKTAMQAGYKGLVIEPIDETPVKLSTLTAPPTPLIH